MGKRILILILPLLLSFSVVGQQLTWSSSQRVKGNNYYSSIVGQNTNGIYLIRAKSNFIKRKFSIEYYNNTLGLEYSRNVKLRSKRFVDALVADNKFYVFTSDENPETELIELSVSEYDNTLQPTGITTVIDQAYPKTTFDKGDYKVTLSPDRTKLVTYHTESSAKGKIIIRLKVLDANDLTTIGDKRIELQYTLNNYKIHSLQIANNGSVFFIGNATNEGEKRRDDYISHYFFCYNPITDLLKEFLLGDEELFTTDAILAVDIENNRMIAAATLSKEHDNSSTGLEVISVGMDSFDLVYNNFITYSYQLKASILGDGRAERGYPLKNFRLANLLVRSDGGVVIFAEEYYVTTQTQTYFSNGVSQTTTRSVYNYDDVFIISINADGTTDWENVINKSQSSVNDGGYYSSFVLGVLEKELKIIFNDRIRGNGDVLAYTITDDGEMTNNILLKSDEFYVAVMPTESAQLTKNTVLVATSKNKRFSLLKLDFRY